MDLSDCVLNGVQYFDEKWKKSYVLSICIVTCTVDLKLQLNQSLVEVIVFDNLTHKCKTIHEATKENIAA